MSDVATKTGEPLAVPEPGMIRPTLISDFNNSGLRESIAAALEGVPADHFRAVLDVDNKGAGVMFVQRFGDTWAVVLAGRYNREERSGEARVVLQGSFR